MKYTKENISKFANETGFISSTLEKVVRLLDVLDFLFRKSSFKDKLVLKGGTAINLVHTNLKRLSVDIDLDYVGALDKETTLKDRELLEKELDNFMVSEEYIISPKSRGSFALFSKAYKYQNSFGNDDIIKVDINFMNRIHLYPYNISAVSFFNKNVSLTTPASEELFAMKLNALIDRSKPRDLYDSVFLANHLELFDENELRKATIFYLSVNGTFDLNKTFINSINQKDIKTELQPVLRKGEWFVLDDAKQKVNNMLSKLLNLTAEEKLYLIEFSKGNFRPELLFKDSITLNIEKHPMAIWRIANINK